MDKERELFPSEFKSDRHFEQIKKKKNEKSQFYGFHILAV